MVNAEKYKDIITTMIETNISDSAVKMENLFCVVKHIVKIVFYYTKVRLMTDVH